MDKSESPKASKTRKPKADKPEGLAVEKPVTKRKATYHLSPEAIERVLVHAHKLGLDRSALIEQLIDDHLRDYHISRNPKKGADGSGSDGGTVRLDRQADPAARQAG